MATRNVDGSTTAPHLVAALDHATGTEKGVVQHTSRIDDELGLPSGGKDHRRVLAVIRCLSAG